MPITDINKFFEFFDKLSDEEFNQMLAKCASPVEASNLIYAEDYTRFMKAQQQQSYVAKAVINITESSPKISYVATNNIGLAA